ncbi:MAG: FtsX-like permease family protein, partial [Terriglobales bacterium]
ARLGVGATARPGPAADTRPGQRLRAVLLVIELAGTLALLVVAGLFARSLWNAQHQPLGFEPRNLVSFHVGLGEGGYRGARARGLADQALAQTRALPGVRAASWALRIPAGDQQLSLGFRIPGYHPPSPGAWEGAYYNAVSPEYFRTMGMHLVSGRGFRPSDGPAAARVAVVNLAFARQYWPGRQALGQVFYLDGASGRPVRVVGVAADARIPHPYGVVDPCLFLPLAQQPALGAAFLLVRSAMPIGTVAPEVMRLVRRLAPMAPVTGAQTMTAALNSLNGYGALRLGAGMAAGLGALALALALVGVYGAMAYAAARRRREVGIRLALGAPPARVLGLLARRGLAIVGAGTAAGLLVALAMGDLLGSMLYGISPHDPVVFAAAAGALALAAFAACLGPALRAVRANPLAAIRQE